MAIVKKYKSEVHKIESPVNDIYVVSFKSLDKPYKYLPGQFLHLALDDYNPSDPWPESRCFSMQTCCEEIFLKITYSVKGRFTGRMSRELQPGKHLYLKLPYGELFIKSHSKENTVFIAGGTGITPFLSLFTSNNFSFYINPKLYLGVRDKNHNIYTSEIDKAKSINNSLITKIIYQDNEGMLDIKKIFEENVPDSTYFISGPPVMIKNFKNYLAEKGVNPEFIRTDDWE